MGDREPTDTVPANAVPTETVRMDLDEVFQLAREALRRGGAGTEQAESVASLVTAAERDGAVAHGLFRVAAYVAGMSTGKVSGVAVPEVVDLAPAVARVDARNGFAAHAFRVGAPVVVDKARTQGVAVLAVTNCYHVSALWPEVEHLCDEGLVAIAMTGAKAFVAPVGGTEPLFGTNPMAFGWPRADGAHMIFDQSSSMSARGAIQLRERDGRTIPEGWAIDADGAPTTDPSAALAGAQLPFAGHKGSSMALMVELLAGALIGQMFSFEASGEFYDDLATSIGGEFILAIDPSRCVAGASDPAAQMQRAELLFAELLRQEGTRLPGSGRYRAREIAEREGVWVKRSLVESLRD